MSSAPARARRVHAEELARGHSFDSERLVVDQDRLTHRLGGIAETALRIAVAKYTIS